MINDDLLNSLILYNKYKRFCFENNLEVKKIKKYESILSSRYQKISRIKKRFIYLIARYKRLYFITFTFDDKHIDLCDRSRKDLIKSSLYSFSPDIKYICNIDYGKINERLHYHCIVATNDYGDLKTHLENVYPSFTYTEEIRLSKSDIKRTSKYINKLSNHAIKDSTRRSRVLYNFKGYDGLDKQYSHVVYLYDAWRIGLT